MKELQTSDLARTIFTNVVKGQNFMTPHLCGYYKIRRGAAELTKGTGFKREEIYGVTVVRNNKHDYDAGQMFFSREEAEDYIKSLKTAN